MHVRHRLPADARIHIDERNRRVKLLTCGDDPAATVAAAIAVAEERQFGKIWGFVSPTAWAVLAHMGFVREGVLDGYYPDSPGYAVGRFLSGERAHSTRQAEEDAIIADTHGCPPHDQAALPLEYHLRAARPEDAQVVSDVLCAVFATYPTPIDSAEAILHSMQNDVQFTVAEYDGAIVSVASADIDRAHAVAEMTDCATLPAHRGRSLMRFMLHAMENALRDEGLRSLFTLARATSAPMNRTFARLGYTYQGRLVNNCHIAGDWEDMNLWVKEMAVQ